MSSRTVGFTGGNDPYKRLETALEADIDPDALESLYQTVSRPFPKPESGKIAVKVINDYGDEVMKVAIKAKLVCEAQHGPSHDEFARVIDKGEL
ncbi:hypothetical protein [Nocardia lasii]|uniref:Uncharacterized protein n=1 Tax=Nocardia lasii TaxID=1616107 RepID=A0ABW1JX62_9NOCA